jgi:uridine kinase
LTQPAACAAIAAIVANSGETTTWIGIDGGTGAGKSHFAAQLAAELPGAAVIAIDDFAGPGIDEWDWSRFRTDVLNPLQAGRPARYRRWNWHDDTAGAWQVVAAGVPVIVEGVSATRQEAGVPWSVRVWVDTDRALRIERVQDRGTPPRLLTGWLATEDAYMLREQPRRHADLIVDGAEPVR